MAGRPLPPAGGSGRPGHGRRRRARRIAIDILFQADITDTAPTEVLALWREAGRAIPPYADELVLGVEREIRELDRVLGRSSQGWPVHRMPVVDRNILRVALHEIQTGVPAAVAINEAVEAASELSTEDSGRFVNGVLGRIARVLQGEPEDGGER